MSRFYFTFIKKKKNLVETGAISTMSGLNGLNTSTVIIVLIVTFIISVVSVLRLFPLLSSIIVWNEAEETMTQTQ